jgi:hypothetical protein
MYSQVLDNFWNKPSYKHPYYYIHNVNNLDNSITNDGSFASSTPFKYTKNTLPTEEGVVWSAGSEKDGESKPIATDYSPSKTIKIGGDTVSAVEVSAVERAAGVRYGNSVRCEIRYGTDDSVFKLKSVYVDYIKVPQTIRLT